jgi:tetratricopeptide (TPR) repeat protein
MDGEPLDPTHPPPDPSGAETFDDIARALRRLRVRAGSPSYRDIHRDVEALRRDRAIPELPSFNTVYRCFDLGRSRLDEELLVDIARVLSGDPDYPALWRTACRRVQLRALQSAIADLPTSLPQPLDGFIDRETETARIRAVADEADRVPAGRLVLVDGMAGVGKSELALHVAHQLREQGRDTVLYINLKGFHGGSEQIPVGPHAVLESFLALLGAPRGQIPTSTPARIEAYLRRLAGRRAVVVLDDAASPEQIGPLVAAVQGCLTVVTSRRRLADAFPAATSIALAPFTDAAAEQYLRTQVGDARVHAEPDVVSKLARVSGHLPLALAQTASVVRSRPDWTLADHLQRVVDRRAGHRLEDAVETALALSYAELPDELGRVLRRISSNPGADIGLPALAALVDRDLETTRAAAAELVSRSLLHRRATDRFDLHDAVHTYARARALDEDSLSDRRLATSRVLDHYVATAATAMDLAYPADRELRPQATLPRKPGPGGPLTPADADAWLRAERQNLVAAAVYAASNGWPANACLMSGILRRFLDTNGYYDDALALHGSALIAARGLEDTAEEASALQRLGTVHWQTGDYGQAHDRLQRALLLHGRTGDNAAQANTLDNLGGVYWAQGRLSDARTAYERALALNRSSGHPASEGRTLNNLGVVHLSLGDDARAVECLLQAVVIARETGDQPGQGTLNNLGVAFSRLGRYDQALEHLLQALEVCRASGFRAGEAACLDSIGGVQRATGHFQRALDSQRSGLAIARDIGDQALCTDIQNSLGETLTDAGRPGDALTEHGQALATARELGVRKEEARALEGIGRALQARGDQQGARSAWRDALVVYGQLSRSEAEAFQARVAGLRSDNPNDPGAEAPQRAQRDRRTP